MSIVVVAAGVGLSWQWYNRGSGSGPSEKQCHQKPEAGGSVAKP